MLGTSATGQFTFNDFNVDVTGHIQHFSTLYSRANLQVLNAASNGWSTWATRNNSTFDLSVGAITTNNSILVYPAWYNIHGVTKIIKHNEDAYRNSLIFYPLSGFDK